MFNVGLKDHLTALDSFKFWTSVKNSGGIRKNLEVKLATFQLSHDLPQY